ncbi:hypothetical protein Dfer_5606 [Dyadobacter fermentans DSM 18053]|uniref:Secretion system C-terminal sorting domain-containing protein n=2 Tax=Dyadobacter fermentans TaxID=94254 RepID=C6VWP6_DYAFD|nr:hypothetical protein Dfer_5606 [Dyadobacter fermentans DSM 18053]
MGRELIIVGTSIANLNGLNNLTNVTNGLQIVANASLTSLTGIGNINELWLRLDGNDALTSLAGMEDFTTIHTLTIDANSLTSLSGLNNLTTVTNVFQISNGTPITNLTGLESLTRANKISFQNLTSLSDVSALGNLIVVDDWLQIVNCPMLSNLNGLSKLEQIGDLILFGNSSLVSLAGLSNLREITNSLTIHTNVQLSECAISAVCDYISVPDASANITGNSGTCADEDAVLAACAALPVTLISFNAAEEAGQAHLAWETAEEINSRSFDIEKSPDAKNWHTIGSVLAMGNSQQLNKYSFTDQYPFPSINYYRLRSEDLDGSYSISKIVSVVMSGENQPVTYPMPAVNGVWIKGVANSSAELLNVHGNVIKTWTITNEKNYLEMGSLSPGLYLIRLSGQTTLRIVKK